MRRRAPLFGLAALAANNGAAPRGPALAPPRSLAELGRAPATSTAVSTAVSIGGLTLPRQR